jgi:HEAT repeat protein
MARYVKLLCLAVVAVFLVWLTTWFFRTPDPSFEGKRLSEWAEEALNHQNARYFDPAVRELGTNSIPFLLHELFAKDSKAKRFLLDFLEQHSISIRWRPAADHKWVACSGLRELRNQAGLEQTVPIILDRLQNEPDMEERGYLIYALGAIGPQAKAAIPVILPYLNGTNLDLRFNATRSLVEIHEDPAVMIPFITRNLTNSQTVILKETIKALGSFGSGATSAVPALLELATNNPTPDRSFLISDELRKIDPVAAKIAESNYWDCLIARMKSSNVQHRRRAMGHIYAMPQIPPPILACLTESLTNADAYLRQHAVVRLSGCGTAATVSLPILRQLSTSDLDENVRREAAAAVTLILSHPEGVTHWSEFIYDRTSSRRFPSGLAEPIYLSDQDGSVK